MYPYTRSMSEWGSAYIAAFYSVMVIFATIGYGDNYARILPEYPFFMLSELAGISVFSILMKAAQGMMKDNQ